MFTHSLTECYAQGSRSVLFLPSPLLTKEGKEVSEIVNELMNTYKDDAAAASPEFKLLSGNRNIRHNL